MTHVASGRVSGQRNVVADRAGALITTCAPLDLEDRRQFAAAFAVPRAHAAVEALTNDLEVGTVFSATPKILISRTT